MEWGTSAESTRCFPDLPREALGLGRVRAESSHREWVCPGKSGSRESTRHGAGTSPIKSSKAGAPGNPPEGPAPSCWHPETILGMLGGVCSQRLGGKETIPAVIPEEGTPDNSSCYYTKVCAPENSWHPPHNRSHPRSPFPSRNGIWIATGMLFPLTSGSTLGKLPLSPDCVLNCGQSFPRCLQPEVPLQARAVIDFLFHFHPGNSSQRRPGCVPIPQGWRAGKWELSFPSRKTQTKPKEFTHDFSRCPPLGMLKTTFILLEAAPTRELSRLTHSSPKKVSGHGEELRLKSTEASQR